MSFHHDNPIFIQRFTGDGAETIFNLDYSPVSDEKVYLFVDGAQSTLTTDHTVTTGATPVVTFEAGSVPADGAKIIVFYEVAEENLVNA